MVALGMAMKLAAMGTELVHCVGIWKTLPCLGMGIFLSPGPLVSSLPPLNRSHLDR